MPQQPKTQAIHLRLPPKLCQDLENEAQQQQLSLADLIRKRIENNHPSPTPLARLPLGDILQRTRPAQLKPDQRLDFYS